MADIVVKDRDGNDVTYEGITAVQVKNADGGIEQFVPLSSGSGDFGAVSKAINFYDIYGNIVHSYTRAEMAALTELPEAPEVPGYEFAGWSWTLAELQGVVAFADVGARYKKADSYSTALLVVDVDKGLTLPLYFGCYLTAGTVTIDWGDGTTSSVSVSSNGNSSASHTYSITGTVIIGISAKGNYPYLYLGKYSTSITQSRYGVIGGSSTSYSDRLLAVTGYRTYLGSGSLYEEYKLRYICGTSLGYSYYVPYKCYALKTFAGAILEQTDAGSFDYCYALERLVFKNTVSSGSARYMYGLKDVYYFRGFENYLSNHRIRNFIINSTSAPYTASLLTTYGLRIYVPDDAVETFKASSNWSNYANYIHPLSEYPDY